MDYYVRIKFDHGAVFTVLLEADGFDDEGDWSVPGHWLSPNHGYWTTGLQGICLYDIEPSTINYVRGRRSNLMAYLGFERIPLSVGSTSVGQILSGNGLIAGWFTCEVGQRD
jgi:hypothetical protein